MRFPTLAACVALLSPCIAAEPFDHMVEISDGPVPPFVNAGFDVSPEFAGGHLSGLIELPLNSEPDATIRTGADAVFEASASLLWAAYLNVPPTVPAGQTIVLGPVLDEPSKVAGIYIPEPGKVRFGVADGATLAGDFAHEFDFGSEVEPISYLSSSAIQQFALTLDEGASVSLLTVDSTGNKLIDKTYEATSFGAGSSQFVDPIINPDGEVTHLHVRNDAGLTHTRTLIRLLETGGVAWAKQVQMNGFVFPFPFYPFTAPDESYIVNFPTSVGHSFVKINPDGSLGWAKTIGKFFIPAPVFSDDGQTVWFTARTSLDPLEIDNTIVAGFDLASGDPVAAFKPGSGYDFLQVFHATGARVYFHMRRNPCEWVAGWASPDLSSISAFERTDVLGQLIPSYRNDTWVATSQFDTATSRVLMVELDGDFQSGEVQCPGFSPLEISFEPVVLDITPFVPAVTDMPVTAGDSGTTLTPATLPFAELPLDIRSCEYASFIPDKAPALATSFDQDDGFRIVLPSYKNRVYELLSVDDLAADPQQIDGLPGTGATISFEIPDVSSPSGFFVIRHHPKPLE
jgi:hypothetical protein